MTTVDTFVREATELLAAKDRIISQLTHDLRTSITALARHEDHNETATAYRHLGRHLPEDPWAP